MWKLFKKGAQKEEQPEVKSGEERRRMERIDMILTINCSIPGEMDHFRIMTENVNVLGVKFTSAIELKSGQIIDMQILLKSHFPTIKVKGKVVWCARRETEGKPGFEGGIEFMPYDEEEKKFFQKFISQRASKVGDLENL